MMKDQIFWKKRAREGAVLNPVDRIAEVLFGLIMVLSFTGAISASTDAREEVGELLWAALGCNVAWGLVDAIMYLMNVAVERGHTQAPAHPSRAFRGRQRQVEREGAVQGLASGQARSQGNRRHGRRGPRQPARRVRQHQTVRPGVDRLEQRLG